jgi:hypothetical protein
LPIKSAVLFLSALVREQEALPPVLLGESLQQRDGLAQCTCRLGLFEQEKKGADKAWASRKEKSGFGEQVQAAVTELPTVIDKKVEYRR